MQARGQRPRLEVMSRSCGASRNERMISGANVLLSEKKRVDANRKIRLRIPEIVPKERKTCSCYEMAFTKREIEVG